MKHLIFVTLITLLSLSIHADDVDSLIDRVDIAVAENRYTQAITLLEEGKVSWPRDTRILIRAGKLYLEQKLYHLALAEFLKADQLEPNNPYILFDIARTYSYLGSYNTAVDSLEDALDVVEEGALRISIIDDLSWMYFKTHRMDEGITLLEDVLQDQYNRGWAHTLGTLYSGVYNAELAREWYLNSIDDALNKGDEFFASVAFYNLSILEQTFYQYDKAREYASRSLELRERTNGYIITGELEFMSWNLHDSIKAYRTAESMDVTPLSRVNIAYFSRRIGRLDEAVRYINDVLAEGDDSWMHSYGINTQRFNMDLNEILAAAWKGKAKTEALTPQGGIGGHVHRFIRSLIWNIRGIYHDMKYRALSSQYVSELTAEGNILDSEWYAYRLNQGYGQPAIRHLDNAQALETALTVLAVPWYLLESGKEKGKQTDINLALNSFQSDEREPVERSLRALAEITSRRKDTESDKALTDLYAINPGGLRQYGLSLPVHLVISGEKLPLLKRRITRILRSAGYRITGKRESSTSTLTLSMRDEKLYWYLSSPEGKTISEARTGIIEKSRDVAEVLTGLLDRFYEI